VLLRALRFRHRTVLDKHQNLSYKNVVRLERIYKQVSCLQLQEENVVNAIIKDDNLVAALLLHYMSLDNIRSL
jgi:hypothetical protein